MTKKKHRLSVIFSVVILVFVLIVNILCCTVFDVALRYFVGEISTSAGSDEEENAYIYNSATRDASEIRGDFQNLAEEIAGEGYVMLQYDSDYLPMSTDKTISIFGHTCATIGSVNCNLKTAFENAGFAVNETLWDFYSKGEGKNYTIGTGSINFGDDMDYSINECPLSVITADTDVTESLSGTTAVYVVTRICGEGVDPARGMVSSSDVAEDQAKTYLEFNSDEIEILNYLNENFEEVIIVVNSNNPMELGLLDQYKNIRGVFYVNGTKNTSLNSLPKLISGEINPSGHMTDTWSYDVLSSAAAQNTGDFEYAMDGKGTGYNYLTYAEGIYVGYRYYESRYEDVILGQGNAGDYDYSTVVQYPFGYGLSYTNFEWSDYTASWDGDTCTVSVTVKNTGSASGKDVVQIYAQTPYTDYDRANRIEKSSVVLVGYEKTGLLTPGEEETITVSFEKEQLKSYDTYGASTYIIEDGDYYVTAASDAHQAINNILLAKEENGSLLTAELTGSQGNAAMASLFHVDGEFNENGVDAVTYSCDTTSGAKITNQLVNISEPDDITWLTRNDWTGTFPVSDGTPTADTSAIKWGNAVTEDNPYGVTLMQEISDEGLETLKLTGLEGSLNPDTKEYEAVTLGAKKTLSLIEMRGKDYDDPDWNTLLSQLNAGEITQLIAQAGFSTVEVDSVNKPKCLDGDSATGYSFSSNSGSIPGVNVLAQTFNRELAETFGELVADDMVSSGATGWYAPAVNLHRSPFTARANEYYGEDSFLSGDMASQEILGASGNGLYVFVKHFAFNEQDLHRGDRSGEEGLSTWLNEQSARELYLTPFEMCVKCGTTTQIYYEEDENGKLVSVEYEADACTGIMSSFNRLGYTWTGGCYPLITGILRNEWGYNGVVLTDYDNGGYMDTLQALYAGATDKLNTLNTCNYSLDTSNNMEEHYALEAVHQQLYQIVNSAAMNGYYVDTSAKKAVPYYWFILMAVDLISLTGIFFILHKDRVIKRKEKQKNHAEESEK